MWFISRHFLGSRQHALIVDGEITWVNDVPSDILSYPANDNDPLSLSSFLAIGKGSQLTILPPNIHKSLLTSGIPLATAGASFLVRPYELQKNIRNFVKNVQAQLSFLEKYQETYVTNTMVLDKCRAALYSSADLGLVKDGTKITLDKTGFAPRAIYNLSGGKTGRMTIQAGPSILTCSRDIKKCIRSRFQNGSIIEVDFSSLEPRTALAVIGSKLCEAPDIYEHVGKLFFPVLPRDLAKQVTISFLYGAAKNTIKCFIGDRLEVDAKLDEMKEMFGFDEIVGSALRQINERGFFTNHCGRPIYPQSSKLGLLFNNFCQSSAVDVALSGFSNLLKGMEADSLKSVPLYFIHDALILDVPPDEVDTVLQRSSTLCTYFGLKFPAKAKILHN